MRRIAEDRYHETSRRLSGTTAIAATFLHILTVAAAGVSGRSLAIVAGSLALTVPFNTWVTFVVLKARGPAFAEIFRMIVNTTIMVVENHYLHWPLPVWLWLPFVGVSFDAFDGPLMGTLLFAMCGADAAVAVADGVSWVYPVTFTALAVFIRVVAELRLDITRRMFETSEAQRRELDAAHASLTMANDRLVSEIRARAKAELELRQAQELEAIGRLAAGAAHEINTPLQFIGDSLTFVHEAMAEETGDVVDALRTALEGVKRVSTIVSSLKELAYPDRAGAPLAKTPADPLFSDGPPDSCPPHPQ